MGIVRRNDAVIGPNPLYGLDRRLFVNIEREAALALEIFAGQHRELLLTFRTPLLPLAVKAPQPPREPPSRALKKGAAQFRVPFQNTAGRHACQRQHQFHWSARGVCNWVLIIVANKSMLNIVPER